MWHSHRLTMKRMIGLCKMSTAKMLRFHDQSAVSEYGIQRRELMTKWKHIWMVRQRPMKPKLFGMKCSKNSNLREATNTLMIWSLLFKRKNDFICCLLVWFDRTYFIKQDEKK